MPAKIDISDEIANFFDFNFRTKSSFFNNFCNLF